MLAGADQHLSDVPEPLCEEEEFAELIDNMVADEAPRIFAVVQELGERGDARIAGWGMSFDDSAHVVSLDGRTLMCLSSPERALVGFRMGGRVTPRLVWVNPDAATPIEDDS